MFYDKKVTILQQTDGYLDDGGIWHEGQLKPIKTILADVQPYSKDLAYKDYGFNEEVTYRVFSDVDELINVGSRVIYRDSTYIIKKIIEWDDFVEWMIHVT